MKFKPSIIIHLAAQAGVRYSIEKPRVYLDSNITGTYNVIECAKKVNIKHWYKKWSDKREDYWGRDNFKSYTD